MNSKWAFGTTEEAAEKVENSMTRMTKNASNFRKNAHIEFKCDVFSNISKILLFSAASSVVPEGPNECRALGRL
jgi:hypothetical protein